METVLLKLHVNKDSVCAVHNNKYYWDYFKNCRLAYNIQELTLYTTT